MSERQRMEARSSSMAAYDPSHAPFMRRALEVALNGQGLASPNPLVGAVVVSGGRVVAEGWHEGPGTPHAEARALSRAGERARGGTLYVTLEPCAHHGRTPPCVDAVISSGVAEVVLGVRDPNPVVDGAGTRALAAAGVRVTEGVLVRACEDLVRGFARHVRTGLPFVTLKLASSLDGKAAARDRSSRWITGQEARHEAHRLRAASDAVVVGAGTVIADDPALTVRLEGYRGRQPLRVVVDGRGRTPSGAVLLADGGRTLVATGPSSPEEARARWAVAGADVLVLDEGAPNGTVPLRRLMAELGKRDVQHVLIEGGPTLAWSAIQDDVVDRVVLYLAPKLVGGERAPGVLGGGGIASIADAIPLELVTVERVGEDLKIVAEPRRDGVHGDR